MNTISDKVLKRIKEQKLAPRPRWQYWLRDGSRWLGFALLVLLAIMALGLLLFFWTDNPGLLGGHFGLGLFFGRMPLLLIGLALVGGLLALLDFKYTGRGYRYPLFLIGALIIAVALFSGWLFNYLGLSRGLDRAISRVPFYQPQAEYMVSVWQQPDQGRLIGQIIRLESPTNFAFRDVVGQDWSVSSKGAIWRHNLEPAQGLQIKLLGTRLGSGGFEATDIRPFMPQKGGCEARVGQTTCGFER